jgi:hypothetical protein
LTNVEQVRSIEARALRVLDKVTFRLAEWFGIGPWYCICCGTRRLLFPPYRRHAGSYDPRSRPDGRLAEAEFESLGNLYFSAVSLVHRSQRANRYSEKFRDGIAEQLLACDFTFSQARQRLGVTDLDLQDWIAHYHRKCLGPQPILIESESGSPANPPTVQSPQSEPDRPPKKKPVESRSP